MSEYGGPPIDCGDFSDVEMVELCHYLYLPVCMPFRLLAKIPRRLEPLRELVYAATDHEEGSGVSLEDHYVYLTARRGWATDDNPLNRPGWHCDGFGTTDINYVWWHGRGTRFAEQPFEGISPGHQTSMEQFEHQVLADSIVDDYPERHLYRLDPFVVHATPRYSPGEGEMRSFVKVSISPHRYNLLGNSHNYDFDYEWEMHDRSAVRNDPAYPEADFIIES